jgi:hypothetical protein
MIKKAGWGFIVIYTAAILFLNIAALIKPDSTGFSLNSVVFILIMLLPAGVIAFELSGKKVPLIIILVPLIITVVFFLGIVKFNSMGIDTIAKAILFGITILILGYMGYKRIFKK